MKTPPPVVSLRYPGNTLVGPSGWGLFSVLRSVESELSEAAIAVTLFDRTSKQVTEERVTGEEAVRRSELAATYTKDCLNLFSAWSRLEAEMARERLSVGEIPHEHVGHLLLFYARAFVSSLRIIRGLLDVVQDDNGIDLTAEIASLDSAVPHLKDVRDASAHRDERARRLVKHEPIKSSLVVVEHLAEDVLVSTIGRRGELGRVPINDATLARVVESVQAVVNRLPWEGQPSEWYF